ncbi:MAG TPA: sn-glycerol-3-phosphate ABC transporter ATP-binding protein UgpC [Acidimicrobiales bacterium]|nr:sn-glycerol-3-phosphate ABC transporter ATP-binding protein UgpC [Acidimicrobiales bacterium]
MAGVTMDKVTKVYPNGVAAVIDLDLDVADGEFLVLVGPSGCGKSTALRMVAGLETITSGEMLIGDRVVNDLPPKERDIAMVFQNYALYPHMTVEQNIGFALKLAKLPKDEIRERVLTAAKVLQLEEWLNRKPGQLSGGQRQRVAMGRAIVRNPSVFLMDEPLSNLDAKLRAQTRAEIASLQRSLGTTTIYVTHDQIEAMTMGDRVAVMREGRLQQVDEPEVLYAEPSNLFVAAFIGSPSMNLLEGTVAVSGDGATVTLGDQSLRVPASALAARPALRGFDGRDVVVGIRPEHLTDAALAGAGAPTDGARLQGVVELREALGSELLVHVRTDCRPAVTEDVRSVAGDVDQAAIELLERQAAGEGAMVVARFDARSRARVTDAVEMDVDVERLQFFDPHTGQRIADEELVPAGAAAPSAVAAAPAQAPSDAG